jgi:hypothetical protein
MNAFHDVAEAARSEAEQFRRLAEEARAVRDRHRDALETIRQERELLRETAETARSASEEARSASEEARVAAEAARHAVVDAVRATAATLNASLDQMKVVEEMRRTLREIRDVNKLEPNEARVGDGPQSCVHNGTASAGPIEHSRRVWARFAEAPLSRIDSPCEGGGYVPPSFLPRGDASPENSHAVHHRRRAVDRVVTRVRRDLHDRLVRPCAVGHRARAVPGRAAERATHAGIAAPQDGECPVTSAIAAINSPGSSGLATCAWKPAARARVRSSARA